MSSRYVYTQILTFEPIPYLERGTYTQHAPFVPPSTPLPPSPYRPSPPFPYVGRYPHLQIHPFLNGEAPPTDFYFDLASVSFSPLRVGPGLPAVISAHKLHEPATYPSITRMRISHHAVPQWPIDLEFHYGGYTAPVTPRPITLGDVLRMIHSSLHRQITHGDWAGISLSRQTAIARAYTRRCRNVPPSELVATRGVKRVDYLLEGHVFKGLIRTHDEGGFHHWKLITA